MCKKFKNSQKKKIKYIKQKEVMKFLRNANFKYRTTNTETQFNTRKRIRYEENNGKRQHRTESTKSDFINKNTRNEQNLKILCKAKEEFQNLKKEQNQQLKGLISEKDQQTQTILNAQSTNNELEQQATSLKRVKLQLETTIHFLEKLQIRKKPESFRRIRENSSQT